MQQYFDKPFKAKKNNRKLTRGRIALEKKENVQSIPITIEGQFLGYKYIYHK